MLRLGTTLLLVIALGAEASGGPPELAAARRELEGAWSRIEAKSRAGQWDIIDKRYEPAPKQTLLSHSVTQVRRNGANVRSEKHNIFAIADSAKRGGESAAETVEMINASYYCRLTRRPGTTDWMMAADPILRDDASSAAQFTTHAAEMSRPLATSHLTFGTTSLYDTLGDKSFDLKSLGPSQFNAGCFRLTYTTKTPAAQNGTTDGWIDLDPAVGWTMREASTVYTAGTTVITSSQRFIVRRDDAGVPELVGERSTLRRTRSSVVNMHIDRDVTYQFDPTSNFPEREFTLSAYGLPEPVGVTWEKPTPRYVWLLVVAGVLAVVALACGWLARRSRRRVAVTSPSPEVGL